MQQRQFDIQNGAIFQAQQSVIRTGARMSKLAFDYTLELSRTWFELWQKQVKQLSDLPQRLIECQSPEEVVSANAELIEKTTQDYREGFNRLAAVGQEMAQEARQTAERGFERARAAAQQATGKPRGEEARAA
jgi:uncharacterized membrane-anchored protein YhcB (DUF1043 family)